ncbi:MAG TPA: hypothetical protein VN033_13585 [Vulgatibacter sp.]|nr:hypothetical protein [Vulgatibacter sp.]
MSVPEIVCQFCHARQPNAWDCAHCGRPLHERPTLQGLQTPTLPELELHAFDAGNVAVAQVEGLEPTAVVDEASPPPDLPAGTLEGLEVTRVDDPGEVPTDFSIELEPTQVAEAEAPEERGPIVCRYCRTPWREGMSVFCVRCGMRIS